MHKQEPLEDSPHEETPNNLGPVSPAVSASQQTCKGGKEKILERSTDKDSSQQDLEDNPWFVLKKWFLSSSTGGYHHPLLIF